MIIKKGYIPQWGITWRILMRTFDAVILLFALLSLTGCATGPRPSRLDGAAPGQLVDLAREQKGEEIRRLFTGGVNLNAADEEGRTALHWAALNRDLQTAEILLNEGAAPDPRDNAGLTPLHVSIVNRDPALVRLLVNNGADILAQTSMGETALNMAFERDFEVLEVLVTSESVNKILDDGNTLLHLAAQRGHLLFVDHLLSLGGDPNARNSRKELPLDLALALDDYPHMEVAARLIKEGSHQPSLAEKSYFYTILQAGSILSRFEGGKTAWHIAAERCHQGILEYLLKTKPGYENIQDSKGNTPLHAAALAGNQKGVERLSGSGADIGRVNNAGNTPLHEAVVRGSSSIMISHLILSGAEVNGKNQQGNTPLHIAAAGLSDPVVFGILIDNGAEVNSRNKAGNTPLLEAMFHENRDAAQTLILKGADIFGRNQQEINPVALALEGGVDVIDWFFTEKSVNKTDNQGESVLHAAIRMDAGAEIVHLLLRKGGDPNLRNFSGETPFLLATHDRKLPLTALFFQFDGDPYIRSQNGVSPLQAAFDADLDYLDAFLPDAKKDLPDSKGETPLFHAVRSGMPDIAEFLVKKKGCNLEWENNRGQTPLFVAVVSSRLATVRMLISCGAKVNARDSFGNTPLFYVSLLSDPVAVGDLLLASGAETGIRNHEGRTVLHEAVLAGNSFFIKYLIDRGSDVDTNDNLGQTPLFLAISRDYVDIIQYLLKRKASMTFRDLNGNTALHRALISGKYNAARFLIQNGSDLHAINRQGESPMLLILFTPQEVAEEFFNAENIAQYDNQGNTPLHLAALKKAPLAIIRMLLDKGSDRLARNNEGKRPIDLAREVAYAEALPLLEDKGP